MKKLTLSIVLLVGVLSSSAPSQCASVTERTTLQTAATHVPSFTGTRVCTVNYYTSTTLGEARLKQLNK